MKVLDWLVLFAYLALSLGVGIAFTARQHSTKDYFLGGQKYGSWMVGLSVLATGLSAITFLGVPGFVVARDWSLMISSAIAIPAAIYVGKVFVPFFYRQKITSAYEYLEHRFSARVALLNSAIFLFLRGTLAGVAIYAPSLALSAVTGWNLFTCIVISGIVTVFYTALGGISAVIWTDVVQILVLFGGAITLAVMIGLQLDGSVVASMSTVLEAGKLNALDWRFSWTEMTFWNSVIGGFVFSVAFYGVDQVLVQRYLTSKSLPDAQKSLYLNAIFALPVIVLFFLMGTLLWLFKQQSPQFFPAHLSADQLMPYYIVTNLPSGLPGLLIAAIYAGAMSTLSSVLNSLSAVTVTDFYKRFSPRAQNEEHCLRMARLFTFMWGLIAIVAALGCNRLSESVAVAAIKAGSLFSGPLLGTFVLGMFFSSCASGPAFWSGILGLLVSFLLGFLTPLDVFWLVTAGTAITVGSGLMFQLVLSFLRQAPDADCADS